jgi:rfaE bifunctional protein kinase chain/domain
METVSAPSQDSLIRGRIRGRRAFYNEPNCVQKPRREIDNYTMSKLTANFPVYRVLIVGDVMLDDYLWGSVRRVCPEAPVPIVEARERSCRPGGAGNAACNVAALGGRAYLAGVTGADEAGQRLRTALAEANVDAGGLIACDDRPTTAKLRVFAHAHNQQVLRIDTEQTHPLPRAVAERLAANVERLIPNCHALLLCDYAKGVLSADLTARFIEAARRANVPVVVDPKGKGFGRYRGATVVKPNLLECGMRSAECGIKTKKDVAEFEAAVRRLSEELPGTAILVTQGAEGMTLFEPGEEAYHQPARGPRTVFDVTGAGDTVAAVVTLMLACGEPLRRAVEVATVAAGIVVGKLGTAVVHPEELEAALRERTRRAARKSPRKRTSEQLVALGAHDGR